MENIKKFFIEKLSFKKIVYEELSKKDKLLLWIWGLLVILSNIGFMMFFDKNKILISLLMFIVIWSYGIFCVKTINKVLREVYNLPIPSKSFYFPSIELEELREKKLLNFLRDNKYDDPKQIDIIVNILIEESEELKFKSIGSKGLIVGGLLSAWNNYVSKFMDTSRSEEPIFLFFKVILQLLILLFIYEILVQIFNGIISIIFNQHSTRYKSIAKLLKKVSITILSEKQYVS